MYISKFEFSSGIITWNILHEKKLNLNLESIIKFFPFFNLRLSTFNFPLLNISINSSLFISGSIYSVKYFETIP